jgi:hypothetical protein
MPEEIAPITLRDLQAQIDFVRENHDDWADFTIQAEVGAGDNTILVTEFSESYIDEEDSVFVLVT